MVSERKEATLLGKQVFLGYRGRTDHGQQTTENTRVSFEWGFAASTENPRINISRKTHTSISPFIPSFHVIHKGLVGYFVAAGGGVVARKVPVAKVVRTGRMEVFNGLINNFHISKNVVRPYYFRDFSG